MPTGHTTASSVSSLNSSPSDHPPNLNANSQIEMTISRLVETLKSNKEEKNGEKFREEDDIYSPNTTNSFGLTNSTSMQHINSMRHTEVGNYQTI